MEKSLKQSRRSAAEPVREPRVVPRLLLTCGILSSLLYVAMNVYFPMQWDGYSSASQTVSELSAVGAPTRPLWVLLGSCLRVTPRRFWIWRLAIGSGEPTLARRGRFTDR